MLNPSLSLSLTFKINQSMGYSQTHDNILSLMFKLIHSLCHLPNLSLTHSLSISLTRLLNYHVIYLIYTDWHTHSFIKFYLSFSFFSFSHSLSFSCSKSFIQQIFQIARYLRNFIWLKNKLLSDSLKNFGEFPRFPCIWEFPQITRHLRNSRNLSNSCRIPQNVWVFGKLFPKFRILTIF